MFGHQRSLEAQQPGGHWQLIAGNTCVAPRMSSVGASKNGGWRGCACWQPSARADIGVRFVTRATGACEHFGRVRDVAPPAEVTAVTSPGCEGMWRHTNHRACVVWTAVGLCRLCLQYAARTVCSLCRHAYLPLRWSVVWYVVCVMAVLLGALVSLPLQVPCASCCVDLGLCGWLVCRLWPLVIELQRGMSAGMLTALWLCRAPAAVIMLQQRPL